MEDSALVSKVEGVGLRVLWKALASVATALPSWPQLGSGLGLRIQGLMVLGC